MRGVSARRSPYFHCLLRLSNLVLALVLHDAILIAVHLHGPMESVMYQSGVVSLWLVLARDERGVVRIDYSAWLEMWRDRYPGCSDRNSYSSQVKSDGRSPRFYKATELSHC